MIKLEYPSLSSKQQGRQGIHALHTVQGFQPIEQDVLDTWHYHPLNRRALEIVPAATPHQPPVCGTGAVLPVRYHGEQPANTTVRQVLYNLCSCLFHRPPPSVDDLSRYRGK
jgi:hypothetical protein